MMLTIESGDKYRLMLMRREEAMAIESRGLPEPFITASISPRGWKSALAVLLGRYALTVGVVDTRQAYRVVESRDDKPLDDTELMTALMSQGWTEATGVMT